MNLDLKTIPAKLTPLLNNIKEYSGFIIVLVILVSYGFIIWQIRSYVIQSPSEAKVSEEVLKLNLPKVDEQAIQTIEQLEDSNIQVKALFENARQNPFVE